MLKALDLWLPAYLCRAPRPPVEGVTDILLCVCDHFEPYHAVNQAGALDRLALWTDRFPPMIEPFRDADGVRPRHTFFYPIEQYDAAVLARLKTLCDRCGGEVEVHLHHDRDTAGALREKLELGKDRLAGHGLLSRDHEGRTRYGFIHGNWALDDSHPAGRHCGVRNELAVLRETGCYADFTMPSAPDPTQTRTINSLYYAVDTPAPKSHDSGRPARVSRPAETPSPGAPGEPPPPSRDAQAGHEPVLRHPLTRPSGALSPTGGEGRGENAPNDFAPCTPEPPPHPAGGHPLPHRGKGQGEGAAGEREVHGEGAVPGKPARSSVAAEALLLVQGPLGLNWVRRKWGLLPRIENGDLTGANPPRLDRLRIWLRLGIHVQGRPEWVFVKVHTHGAIPANSGMFLGEPMRQFHQLLAGSFNDGQRHRLHYVTAREMVNILHAAEDGHTGNPGQFRDYRYRLTA